MLYILISSLLFAIVSLLVRYATSEKNISVFFIVFIRGLVSLPLIFMLTIIRGAPILGVNKRGLIFRGLAGSGGMILSFFAISKTYVANAMVLLYTYPIYAAIIASIIAGEKLGKKIILLLISFAGIAMIIKPEVAVFNVGEIMGLISGIFAGIAVFLVRDLRKTDVPLNIIKYLLMVSFIIATPYVITHWQPISTEGLIIVILISLFAATAQYLMTVGYRECTNIEGGILSYITIIAATAGAFLIFSEVPETLDFIGAFFIIASSVILIVFHKKALNRQTSSGINI